MSGNELFSRRSYGALMSRLVWPTATLLFLTLGFVFSTILWTSDSANTTASKRQRMQLTGAIEQKLEELESRVAQLAATPGLLARLQQPDPLRDLEPSPSAAARSSGLSGIILFGPDERSLLAGKETTSNLERDRISALLGPLVETVRSSLAEKPQAPVLRPRRLAASRLFSDGLSGSTGHP